MAKQRDNGKTRGFVPGIGFATLAGKKLRGAVRDGDITEGNPRLKDLPDFENDHLRGSDTDPEDQAVTPID